LSTSERVKKLNKSIQRRAAAATIANKSNQTGTSLLPRYTNSLPVAAIKTSNVSPVVKRIEYDDSYEDEDDDATLSNLDTTCDTISEDVGVSPSDPQEDKTDLITLNNTNASLPKDPEDILADKIASHVANSDGSSLDSMVMNTILSILYMDCYTIYRLLYCIWTVILYMDC